jgi:primase-polymerase (primpol)-like protein
MGSVSKREMESAAAKPAVLPVAPDGIPDKLKQCAQWVCWRYVKKWDKANKQNRWSKVPVIPGTGSNASPTDPKTWDNFTAALEYYRQTSLDGIGFVFTAADPFCGIDLDDCRNPDTGVVADWAQPIISLLDSYAEVSPSATGVKIIVQARKPGSRCKTAYETGKVEIYDRKRFFAMTGHRLPVVEVTP